MNDILCLAVALISLRSPAGCDALLLPYNHLPCPCKLQVSSSKIAFSSSKLSRKCCPEHTPQFQDLEDTCKVSICLAQPSLHQNENGQYILQSTAFQAKSTNITFLALFITSRVGYKFYSDQADQKLQYPWHCFSLSPPRKKMKISICTSFDDVFFGDDSYHVFTTFHQLTGRLWRIQVSR